MSGLSVNSPKLGVDGIVLYLDSFNRKSYDLTLNKRNTSLVNGPILGSDNGIVFDGSDDYLSIPYFDLSNQSFAIDLWYRPSQNATYLRGILSCGDTWSGSANPGWALGFGDSSNTISYGVRSSAGQIYRGSGPTLVPNIIYNLFMVRNAEENLLYLYVKEYMIVDNGQYYLYRYVRLDNNQPFYIGIESKRKTRNSCYMGILAHWTNRYFLFYKNLQ